MSKSTKRPASDYPEWHPIRKRYETIQARRLDQGCRCHHLPLYECPAFRPVLIPCKNGNGMTHLKTNIVSIDKEVRRLQSKFVPTWLPPAA